LDFSLYLGVFVLRPASFAADTLILPPPADVRLLIDISGSMKKNDPDNLRRPALALVTELLPPGALAGVWTFGQQVNELVPHGPVNDAWRAMAREKIPHISSVALFTDIRCRFRKSRPRTQGHQNKPNTHVILLTDGMVDVAPSPEFNVQERERILNTTLVDWLHGSPGAYHRFI